MSEEITESQDSVFIVPEPCLGQGNFLSHMLPQPIQVANPAKHTVSWCSLPLERRSGGLRAALSAIPSLPGTSCFVTACRGLC